MDRISYLFIRVPSITTSTRGNRNACSAGRYWLLKVFVILRDYLDSIILEDIVYYDETFFTQIESKKKQPDGKEYRGISRNKFCVVLANDSHDHIVLIMRNVSTPSLKSIWNTLSFHAKEGSTFVHNDKRSHSVLIDRLKPVSIAYDTEQIILIKTIL